MFYFTTIRKEYIGKKQIILILHEFNKDSKFIHDCYRIAVLENGFVIQEEKINCEVGKEQALKIYENIKNSFIDK